MPADDFAPNSESVPRLLHRAQSGDRAAESALCERFAPAIRSFARRRLHGADAVNEFTQDVIVLFVEALRRAAVQEPSKLGGFVLGICRNVAHDRASMRERRTELWERYAADLARLETNSTITPTYETLKLEDCLSKLSSRSREIMKLSYAEARSHAEIADRMHISEANARVLRHRTLEALRECMEKPISWEVR